MRVVKISTKTHSIQLLAEMDVSTLLRRAHSVSTFQGKHYIVLDNGNLYDQSRKQEVPVGDMFKYIKGVRNSDGVLIAKKSKLQGKLMQVRFVKKCKESVR